MAPVPNKNTSPVVAVLASLCCMGVLGYALIGQSRKLMFVFLAALLGTFCFYIPGLVLQICALIDVYKCAEAIARGESVDENEYRVELLYKAVSMIDKTATFKA